MREVTPKELQKLNDKSFKNTQKIFRRRLRKIAADGHTHAEYQPKDYKYGERIKPWLESLGFKVKEIGPSWCKVTWPEEEDILARLHSESFKILTRPISAKVHYAIGWLNSEEKKRRWHLVSGLMTSTPMIVFVQNVANTLNILPRIARIAARNSNP